MSGPVTLHTDATSTALLIDMRHPDAGKAVCAIMAGLAAGARPVAKRLTPAEFQAQIDALAKLLPSRMGGTADVAQDGRRVA